MTPAYYVLTSTDCSCGAPCIYFYGGAQKIPFTSMSTGRASRRARPQLQVTPPDVCQSRTAGIRKPVVFSDILFVSSASSLCVFHVVRTALYLDLATVWS